MEMTDIWFILVAENFIFLEPLLIFSISYEIVQTSEGAPATEYSGISV